MSTLIKYTGNGSATQIAPSGKVYLFATLANGLKVAEVTDPTDATWFLGQSASFATYEANNVRVLTLFSSAGAGGSGAVTLFPERGNSSFMAVAIGTGAISATVKVYGSSVGPAVSAPKAVLLGTINLSGTDSCAGGFTDNGAWPYVFADVSNPSGTLSSITVTVGR